MTERVLKGFQTGPTPARYVMLSKVGKDGELVAHHLKQQRVRHSIFSSSNEYHVRGQLAALRTLSGQSK